MSLVLLIKIGIENGVSFVIKIKNRILNNISFKKKNGYKKKIKNNKKNYFRKLDHV